MKVLDPRLKAGVVHERCDRKALCERRRCSISRAQILYRRQPVVPGASPSDAIRINQFGCLQNRHPRHLRPQLLALHGVFVG